MTQKLQVDITQYPVKTEVLANTPGAGDQTIYTAYSNPSKSGNLGELVIQRTVVLADTPGVGDTDITDGFAVSAANLNDQLVFNKKWADRAILTYKSISY